MTPTDDLAQAFEEATPPEVETGDVLLVRFVASCALDHVGLPHCRDRRRDLLSVLSLHETATRLCLDAMNPAQDRESWDASWQLRRDVIAALDRCDRREQLAKWARDE